MHIILYIMNYLQLQSVLKSLNCIKKNKNIEQHYKINYKLIAENQTITLSELKEICKEYNIKSSGKKSDLINKINNYCKISLFIIKIQKRWRKYLHTLITSLRGPGLNNRHLCINNTDFFSMVSINKIENNQFFSFKDEDDKIYGFDILSLHNLILKSKELVINPYNRSEIPKCIIDNLYKIIKFSQIYKEPININIKKNEISLNKKLEFRVLNIFQEIDNLGNYTDPNWFWEILQNKQRIIKFIRELCDIWNYRANLSYSIKRDIYPPNGDLFKNFNMHLLINMQLSKLQDISIDLIEILSTRSSNHANRCLGANYVLCALTLVSSEAAYNLPWLYDSVALNTNFF